MSTATDKKILTPDEYREMGQSLRGRMGGWRMTLDATIDDYPIGRSDRGKCRLQVERAKGKGYRTVRTTTDRNGRWCKPKKSVYSNSVIVVVTNVPPAYDHEIQWLYVGESAVSFGAASGGGTVLLAAPHWCKPRREPRHYTINGEPNVLAADPPELCDSWDAWFAEYKILRSIVAEAWAGE